MLLQTLAFYNFWVLADFPHPPLPSSKSSDMSVVETAH